MNISFRSLVSGLLLITTTIIFGADSSPSATNTNNLNKEAIYTQNAPKPMGVFSQAIKVGHTVYISGQIPVDKKTGELISSDFSNEFRQAINNLSEIAKAAGGSLNNIVKVTIYVAHLDYYNTVNQVMQEYFSKPYPARVVIEAEDLPKHASVEIEAIMEI